MGTGIARGFLAAFDTAWQIRGFGEKRNSLELLYERESIYQLLSQTTHDNISKNYSEFTIDPTTRYLNLNVNLKKAIHIDDNQIKNLYDDGTTLFNQIRNNSFDSTTNSSLYFSINCMKQNSTRTQIENHSKTLLKWAQIVVQPYNIKLENFTTSWKDGLPFLAIIHRFQPDLM